MGDGNGASNEYPIPSIAGKGGYSVGYYKTGQKNLYLFVGAIGINGGGFSFYGPCGGGASHIALTDRGELRNYKSYQNEVLIVAGGGGSCEWGNFHAGDGGGLTGGSSNQYGGQNNVCTGGTQNSGGIGSGWSGNGIIIPADFGVGGSAYVSDSNMAPYLGDYGPGGGGGWYGGGGAAYAGASGGGSSHINTNYITNYQMQQGIYESTNGKIIITQIAF